MEKLFCLLVLFVFLSTAAGSVLASGVNGNGSSQSEDVLERVFGARVTQGESGAGGFKVYDNSNNPLGYYAGEGLNPWWIIATEEGYRFKVWMGSGDIVGSANLFYEADNCEGQAYVKANQVKNGEIRRTLDGIMYVPSDAQIIHSFSPRSWTTFSRYNSGECRVPDSNIDAKEINPLDLSVTGFPEHLMVDYKLEVPLSVGR